MKIKNPLKRTTLICCLVALAGIIMIVVPFTFDLKDFSAGYAVGAGGIFVTLVGVISAVIFGRLSRKLDPILKEENILAHWKYSDKQWKEYTQKELKADWRDRKGLFIVIAAITIIVSMLMALLTGDIQFAVLFCLGTIVFVGIIALITGAINYWRHKRQGGEVYLARDGAYFKGQFHHWGGVGTYLNSAAYKDSKRPLITITYSAVAPTGFNRCEIRIPVPPSKEEEAREIVTRIKEAHHISE